MVLTDKSVFLNMLVKFWKMWRVKKNGTKLTACHLSDETFYLLNSVENINPVLFYAQGLQFLPMRV